MLKSACRPLPCPLALLAFLLLLQPAVAAAQEPAETAPQPLRAFQVWVGGLNTDDSWRRQDSVAGEELDGDFGTLPYFGGAGQKLWGRGLEYGYEGGGLVTWKNDSTKFRGAGNSVLVKVDNTLLSVEFFMGGMVSLRLHERLRVYGALGPSVAYAHLNDDDDDDLTEEGVVSPASSRNLELGNGGHSLSLTLYGRAGFEFVTVSGITFGAHARYANHEFDFDDSGKLELDNVQYFFTIGQAL